MLIWLFVYLRKNVYSDFAHFLVGQIRKHWLLGLRVPYIFCMTCKNFHSVGCPVSSMVFIEIFNFHEFQFICFFLLSHIWKGFVQSKVMKIYSYIFPSFSSFSYYISVFDVFWVKFCLWKKNLCMVWGRGPTSKRILLWSVKDLLIFFSCRRLAFYAWMPVDF